MQKWNPVRAAIIGLIAGVIIGLPEHGKALTRGGEAALQALMQLAGMAIGLAVMAAVICVVRNMFVR